MSLNPNAVIIANRLKEKGYTRAQIAGVLGNVELESGFNPQINEGGRVGAPLGEGGYGVAQWTGSRQTGLVNFAKQQQMDPGDINLQAKYLLYELEGPEKKAAAYVRGAVSPEESARRFLTDFERAGIPKTKQRQEAARAIYGKLGFLDQPGQGSVAGTITTAVKKPKETDLFQRMMQQTLMANATYESPVNTLVRGALKDAMSGSLNPNASVNSFSLGLDDLAGLGFPSLL